MSSPLTQTPGFRVRRQEPQGPGETPQKGFGVTDKIPVFLSDRTMLPRIRESYARLAFEVEEVRDLFEELIEPAPVVVLVIPNLHPTQDLRWIKDLTCAHPSKGWILVSNLSINNASLLLRELPDPEVVWVEEIREKLEGETQKLLFSDPLVRFSTNLMESDRVSAEATGVIRSACFLRPLPTTVCGLCRATGIKEDRLRYIWRREFGPSRTPKVFLDTLLLIRAWQARRAQNSWRIAAASVGLDYRTLRRICVRLSGMALGKAGKEMAEGKLDLLHRWWID